MSTRKKLKRNCRFSLLGSSENGLMVKSRASWPTFKYEPPKIEVNDWKLLPMSKMNVRGAYFCAFCRMKLQRYDFPEPVIPRMSVWATSPLCRLRKYGVLLSVSSAARYSAPRCELRVSPGRMVKRKLRSA